jgi:Domain of unknown function (DUF4389)
MHGKDPSNSFSFAKVSIPHSPASNRLTAFFRIFCALPVFIVLVLLSGFHSKDVQWVAPGILFLPTVLAILFRKKYPRWWFDWNFALTKFSLRVMAFVLLLRDEFPALEDDQSVMVELTYPDASKDLSRGMPLVKWLLAIPHIVILIFLLAAVVIVTAAAWFAILFTGRYPAKIHAFVVGVMRWGLRVNAYAFLLITDRYPPFTLTD